MNLAACFIVIFINKGLKEYDGDLAIGAFGIVNRIVFLFVMIVMGLNQACNPLPDTISVPVNTIGLTKY